MPTFVLSDGTVINDYGFRVRTAGLKFDRFDTNPVMLLEHQNSVAAVIGRWKNRIVEGAKLTAEDDFDIADEEANKIKGKVDRGFLKGVSIGFSFNPAKMELMPDGVWELTEAELYEASICALPSNKSSLRLYAADTGKLLTEQEVQMSLSALPTNDNFKNIEMKKIALSLAALTALGFTSEIDESQAGQLSLGIEGLKAKLDAAEKSVNEMKLALETQANAAAQALVDAAEMEGKLTAATKPSFLELAKTNLPLATATLAAIPGKKSLAALVNNTTPSEVNTIDAFEKLSTEAKLAFKANNPDAYKALFA